MTARLPAADRAVAERAKIEGYLLNPAHVSGATKARFFLGRGFRVPSWQEFATALQTHARSNPVTRVVETPWGTRYRVDCNLPTPDGSNPCIRTVWQIALDDDDPRLLTAHPL